MNYACWIPKTTVTQPEHTIRTTFLLQEPLHKHASLLHYNTLSACIVTSLQPESLTEFQPHWNVCFFFSWLNSCNYLNTKQTNPSVKQFKVTAVIR
jgi:hypothetical protein